jgi:hypothetical protein
MNTDWIYDSFYKWTAPSMEPTVGQHISYLLYVMMRCIPYIHPSKPMEYDIHFDEMLDLWGASQTELIGWCSK